MASKIFFVFNNYFSSSSIPATKKLDDGILVMHF